MKALLDAIEKVVFAIDEAITKVAKFSWLLGGICILIMALVTGYSVVTRYVFRNPSALTYPITCLCMVGCVILSLAYNQKIGGNVRLDLFDHILPKWALGFINRFLTPIVGLIFTVTMTWQCWVNTQYALKIGEMTKTEMPMPTFYIKLIITIFMALLSLILLFQLLTELFKLRKKHREAKTDT